MTSPDVAFYLRQLQRIDELTERAMEFARQLHELAAERPGALVPAAAAFERINNLICRNVALSRQIAARAAIAQQVAEERARRLEQRRREADGSEPVRPKARPRLH